MKIIKTDYILTPNKVLSQKCVAFDEKIVGIDDFESLKKRFQDAKVIDCGKNSCLLPGFINLHTHLEFSSNRATLKYGDFLVWLNSVIKNREELIKSCDFNCIDKAIASMLKNGTTTFGAISSFGEDLKACVDAPQRVIYFNEIIGSNPATADIAYSDFLDRVRKSLKYKDDRFIPAVAIHSPYSVHRVLAKKAIDFAKENSLFISTHFMESRAEREWIDSAKGDFQKFFKEFLNQTIPANRAKDFINLFKDTKSLFVHAVWANDEELDMINKEGHSIVHCPVSNRLLGNGRLNIKKIKNIGINLSIATDGLSSNYTLNMYEELKNALFMHYDIDLIDLSFNLLRAATINPAKAINLNTGEIEIGKFADLQVVKLPDDFKNEEEIALSIILHTKKPKSVFIGGKEYV